MEPGRGGVVGLSLVLAEKPSVAREIARVLGCRQKGEGYLGGPQYIVTWALGHLVTLAEPEAYGAQYKTWNLESLPMLPEKMQLVVIRETAKQYRVVEGLLRRADVSDVIIATDAGREGELVARWILVKANCRKPLKRLWISSQTDRAVREGFAALKPGAAYENLYASAQARAEADWLVGLNVTRALTCKHNAQLSAGRVQTPTLAMIVAREKEIRSFVPKTFETIRARCDGFTATWAGPDGHTRLFDPAEVDAVLKRVQGQAAVLTEVKRQMKQKAPPAAYDLTELQRDANRRFAYSAKETLNIMQALYERHKLVTYPRTDSRYIPDDVVASLPDRLRAVSTGPYRDTARRLLGAPLSTRFLVNNAKVTDHHAILPTEEPAELRNLSPEERRIYDLVVRRFLAVLSAPFVYEETRLTLRVGKDTFLARGKIIKDPGWKGIDESVTSDDDDDEAPGKGAARDAGEDVRAQTLPDVRQGDRLPAPVFSRESGKTRPPARYNEATLLSAMENPAGENMSAELRAVLKTTSGLGTPATRADIIEKLFSTFYVERSGKEIVPTAKGMQLISIVPEDLRSAELTARWEQELASISKGTVKRADFVKQMRDFSATLVSRVIASDAKYVHENKTREKCPDCHEFLLEVNGKKGKMLVCPDRACGYRKSLSLQTNARCPNCHKKLELRGEGERRMFTCVCGHREKYADFEKRRETAGASKNDVRRYLDTQTERDAGPTAMAQALQQWKEKQKK